MWDARCGIDSCRSRRIGSLSALVCIVLPLSAIFAAGLIETSNQIQWLQGHQGEIISLLLGLSSGIRIPDLLLDEISRSMADLMAMGLNLLAGLPFFQVGSTIAPGMINILIAFVVCFIAGWRTAGSGGSGDIRSQGRKSGCAASTE